MVIESRGETSEGQEQKEKESPRDGKRIIAAVTAGAVFAFSSND